MAIPGDARKIRVVKTDKGAKNPDTGQGVLWMELSTARVAVQILKECYIFEEESIVGPV